MLSVETTLNLPKTPINRGRNANFTPKTLSVDEKFFFQNSPKAMCK